MPSCSVCSSSSSRWHLALEVALEQLVVGDDDPLDQVVVDLVLDGLHVVGDRLGVGAAPLVDVGRVGEQVGDALELRLRADRQLEGGDARPRAGRGAGRAWRRSWPAPGRAC